MAKELFPIIADPSQIVSAARTLPLAQEMAWDFQADRPIFRGGEPVPVTGAEAVRVWAWNALKTARYRFEMFNFSYGCELERLMGQPFTADTKRSEAARYIQDALLASPYIRRVTVSELSLSEDTLSAAVAIQTIYGEVNVHV